MFAKCVQSVIVHGKDGETGVMARFEAGVPQVIYTTEDLDSANLYRWSGSLKRTLALRF